MVTNPRGGYLLFPSPIADAECLFGYFLRRVERAQGGNIHAVARAAGLASSRFTLIHVEGSLDHLAKILREDPARLRRAAIVSQSRQKGAPLIGFHGQRLRRKSVAYPASRICPACLEEDGHTHLLWHLSLLSECPRHGISLISACHACGREIDWGRPQLLKCRCGADLRKAPRVRSPHYAQLLSAEIARRAAGSKPELFAEHDTNPTGRLQSFIDLCLFVGTRVRGEKYIRYVKHCPTLTEARGILEAAGPILVENEAQGYFSFLDSIFVDPPLGRGRLIRMFPNWYRPLGQHKFLKPLRDGLHRYLLSRRRGQLLGLSGKAQSVKETKADLQPISLWEAARRVGRTTRSVLALADQLGIQPIVTERGPRQTKRRFTGPDFARILKAELGDNPPLPKRLPTPPGMRARRSRQNQGALMIGAADLERIWSNHDFPSEHLTSRITPELLAPAKAIAARLAIQIDGAYSLIDSGFFSRFAGTSGQIPARGIPVGVYAKFEHAIASARATSPAPPAEELISVKGALTKILRRFGVNLAMMLPDLLEGKIGEIWHDARRPGLDGILVLKARVHVYGSVAQQARLGEHMSGPELCARIGAGDHRTIAHLQKAGYLHKSARRIGANYGYDRAEADRFCNTYISLPEICTRGLFPRLSHLPMHLRNDLERLGIHPVIAPDIDGAPLTFYRRDEIERIAHDQKPSAA